jgi:predicted Zn-dependent protease
MDQHQALIELEKSLKQLNATPMGRRLFLSAVPVLVAGCATTVPQHRQREGDNVGQETSITVEDEKQMAREYIPQMEKEYPPHKDKYVQQHINSIGQKIVRENGLHNNPYQYDFTVVDSKMVNAFALPAGAVYVTAPLIKTAGSEAELSGVIGHEIGHVKARHTAERIDRQEKEKSKTLLYGIGGAILGGVAGYGLGKLICSENDKECLRRVALYGGMAGGAGGLLIQKFAFMANSREDEMEADRVGYKTAMNAGYHPQHVGRFYEQLLKMEEEHKQGQSNLLAPFADALSTHPPSQERVDQQKQLVAEFGSTTGVISTPQFQKVQKML